MPSTMLSYFICYYLAKKKKKEKEPLKIETEEVNRRCTVTSICCWRRVSPVKGWTVDDREREA